MSFDSNQRAVLSKLADVLIPAEGDMPSASQADVSGRWLEAVLKARGDLIDGLRDLLNKAESGTAEDVVDRMRSTDPAAFGVLAEIVSGAYFMNPEVRRAIGYSGQEPLPMNPRPDFMEHDLLASVIRRGPIYRPTPHE